MKEIKFRGMTIEGEWVYGLLSHSTGGRGLPEKGWYISNSHGMPWAFLIRPETRNQYTGLKDRIGKEMYEGDVVKITKGWQEGGKTDEVMGVIEYFTPYAGFQVNGIGFGKLYLFPIEIIGNKYENPELKFNW